MAHDFVRFPELTNSQLEVLEFESPHKQITEDFKALVVKVTDGDTIRIRTTFRDFDFPLRFLDIDAKEIGDGGENARDWLHDQIFNKVVQIRMDKFNRVDKWGRLLGRVFNAGLDVGQQEIYLGLATDFTKRMDGKLPSTSKTFRLSQWF